MATPFMSVLVAQSLALLTALSLLTALPAAEAQVTTSGKIYLRGQFKKKDEGVVEFHKLLNVSKISGKLKGIPIEVPLDEVRRVVLLSRDALYAYNPGVSSHGGDLEVYRKKDNKVFLLAEAIFWRSDNLGSLEYTYWNPITERIQEGEVRLRQVQMIDFSDN
jgi:hypothetical protein